MQVETPEVSAEKATTPRFNSRIADKFVVRMPDGMRESVEKSANQVLTSMNTFIVQAVADKLDLDNRQQVLLDALVLAARVKQPPEVSEVDATLKALRSQLVEARQLLHTASIVMSRMLEPEDSPRKEIIALLESNRAIHEGPFNKLRKEGAAA